MASPYSHSRGDLMIQVRSATSLRRSTQEADSECHWSSETTRTSRRPTDSVNLAFLRRDDGHSDRECPCRHRPGVSRGIFLGVAFGAIGWGAIAGSLYLLWN